MTPDDESNIAVFRMLTDRLDDCENGISDCKKALNGILQHLKYNEGRKYDRLDNRLYGYPFPITIEADSHSDLRWKRDYPWLPAVRIIVYLTDCSYCPFAKNEYEEKKKWFLALPNGLKLHAEHGTTSTGVPTDHIRPGYISQFNNAFEEAEYQYIKSKLGDDKFYCFSLMNNEKTYGFTAEGQERDVEYYLTQAMKILQVLRHDVKECVVAVTMTITEPEVLQFIRDVEMFKASEAKLEATDLWAYKSQLRQQSHKPNVCQSLMARDALAYVRSNVQ